MFILLAFLFCANDLEDFFIQRNSFSCGPIALMNARVWEGHKLDYEKHYLDFEKLCCCHPKTGTKASCFSQAAQGFGYVPLHYDDIDKALKRRKSVLLQFWLPEEMDYHYALAVWQTEHLFFILNYDGYNHKWVSKDLVIIRAWRVE